jgi:hypothetical protein
VFDRVATHKRIITVKDLRHDRHGSALVAQDFSPAHINSGGPRSDPEKHTAHDQPEHHGDDHDRAGQAECANEDGGETGRIARRFDDLDDDWLLRLLK